MPVSTHKPHGDLRKAYDAYRGSAHSRGYTALWHTRTRAHILRRDHYLCTKCGKPVGMRGHVHHIKPISEGGTNHPGNLATLCHACHNREHHRNA